MAFIPTPNVARCALEFSYANQNMAMTLWFEAEVAFDTAALVALAERLIEWATDELMPNLSTNLVLQAVRATAQDSESAPSVFVVADPPVAGGGTGASQSPQTAVVVSFRTELRGRSFRGRNYLPGIPDSALSSIGVLGSGAAGTYAVAYAALAGVELDLDVTHVVVSHFTNGVARAAGLTTEVSDYFVDQPLDTQRRRSVGRGA